MTMIAVKCTSTTIDPTDLAFIVQAWDAQSKEFCAAHGIPYVPVVLFDQIPQDQVGTGEVRVMTIADSLPEAPGAEGYHDDELGDIFARILAENNADAGSHECCEENKDPTCNQYVPIPGTTNELAVEVSDPVQALNYPQDATIDGETRQIPVSDWVYPSYFDPNGKRPFDKMDQLTAPFSMAPGGYQIVRDASGNTEDVFAKVVPADEKGHMAAERKRARPDSRLSRRLAKGKKPPEVLRPRDAAKRLAAEAADQAPPAAKGTLPKPPTPSFG